MGSSLIVRGLITYKSSRPDSEKGCGTEFHRPTEQILLGYFWGLVIRFVPGGVIGS